MENLNQQNGIHLSVRASIGLATAGHAWIAVPADGVPADLLAHIEKYLGTREADSRYQMVVDAPTWEAVRAEIERDVQRDIKRREERDEAEAERERARAEEVAIIRAHLAATPATAWQITDPMQLNHLLVPGTNIRLHQSSLPDDLRTLVYAEMDRRKSARDAASAAEEARKAAALAAVLAERDEWIRAHGSARLQKGLAAGLVAKMASVYRDERIAHDLGAEWSSWEVAPEPKANDRLNPEEAELDALTEARTKWPTCDVRLRSVGGGEDDEGESNPWRPALLMACPWDADDTAIRYLDE